MLRTCLLLAMVTLLPSQSVFAVGPDPILLWPDGAPDAAGTEPADKPDIRVYPPAADANTGAAVVICPGGGYGILAYDHEGHQLAEWFRSIGVTGVVLKYRHAPKYRHPSPLQDAQRAIRLVRSRAEEWKIDPNRVGIMGFSAGGHLASTASTHFDAGKADSAGPVEKQSCRPSFSILGYPVISLSADFAHKGSGKNLFGDKVTDEQLKELSNELNVTKETPPAFLFHTNEDKGVPPQNSVAYYSALIAHGVPAELHIYQWGPHGVGMAPGEPAVETWVQQLHGWLRSNGLLTAKKRSHVSGTVTLNGAPMRWGTIAFTPVGDANAPVGWAMVSNGKYDIPAIRGAAIGDCVVTVRTLGSVEPRPTIENFKEVSPHDALRANIVAGDNTLDFSLNN
jgi:acetyl esterase/lipase